MTEISTMADAGEALRALGQLGDLAQEDQDEHAQLYRAVQAFLDAPPWRDLIEIHVEIEQAKTLLDLANERMAMFVQEIDGPEAGNVWFCVLHGVKRHLAAIEAMVCDIEAGRPVNDLVGSMGTAGEA